MLNLLAFAHPVAQWIKVASSFHPEAYRAYEDAPESPYASTIKTIAKRVLNVENQEGAKYRKQIQEMMQVGGPDVNNLVDTSFRVICLKEALPSPVYAVRDLSSRRSFILTHPLIQDMDLAALSFLSPHEICHLLEKDAVKIQTAKAIVSLATTILTTLVLRWSFLSSLGTIVATTLATHVLMAHRAEKRADDFAIKHCTIEEREQAIRFFQQVKEHNDQIPGLLGMAFRVMCFLHHPPDTTRIANIRASLSRANLVRNL